MQWYEDEVRTLERNRANRSNTAAPAVFYGSSTIRLWSTLAQDLGDPGILNLGFGGSTLAACVHFFDRLVKPLDPASLLIYAGDNDLGDGCSPESVLSSFQDLTSKVTAAFPNIPFGFISIKPSPARYSILNRIQHANDLIRREMDTHRNIHYISVFEAMLNSSGKPRGDLFLADGLHLGPAGYRLWTRLLTPVYNQIFKPCSISCNKEKISLS
jgi:lysophospholipase L1-like esterase